MLNQLNLYTHMWFGRKKTVLLSLLFPVATMAVVVWIAGKNMFVNFEDTKSASFIIVCAAIWCGLFNSIQTIVSDRHDTVLDLRSTNAFCYASARAILQTGLVLVQSLIITLSYTLVKLNYGHDLPKSGIIFGSVWFEFFVSIFLIMWSSDMMGLMVSGLVKDKSAANTLAPYILIFELIFSGLFFDMSGLADKFSYLMISRWGMQAVGSTSRLNSLESKLQLEHSHLLPEVIKLVKHKPEAAYKATAAHLQQTWLILFAFGLAFFLVTLLLVSRIKKAAKA